MRKSEKINLVELNAFELNQIEGGNYLVPLFKLGALAAACFGMGYQIGRDLAN